MTFYRFVKETYSGRDSAEGDFAYDMVYVDDFPRESDYDVILGYLCRKHACKEAREVFKAIWKEYERCARKES